MPLNHSPESIPPPFSDPVACENEPIRFPGKIQPHGVLISLHAESHSIAHVSANLDWLSDVPIAAALGSTLVDVLGEEGKVIGKEVSALVPASGAAHLRPRQIKDAHFSITAHRCNELLVLEFERNDNVGTASLDTIYPQIREGVEYLQAAADSKALFQRAAALVRTMTGFDRVLIYQFDEHWNGMVVGEDRNDALPAYFDLRFPASDIPAQARELYQLNRIRLIPDAAYTPVDIVAGGDASQAVHLDLTFSMLRSVSPVHLEYMANMGTPASMSISILTDGRLWGLISCHHASARHVPTHVRAGCDFIAQILSIQILGQQRTVDAALRIERQHIQSSLLGFMAQEKSYIQGLVSHPAELLAIADATGAAAVINGDIFLVGNTPTESQVRLLADWLATEKSEHDVFHTHSLSEQFAGARAFVPHASGLLAISISQIHRSYVIWFRPEIVQTVSWGGDPRKTIDRSTSLERFTPRKSFEAWKETVRAQSKPWLPAEVDTVLLLRNAIIGIVMKKAEELADLTDELKRSNKELEAFSYSVSHDLRAPFRHIVGYAELLKDMQPLKDDDRSRRYVDTIIESANTAGRLVDGLLSFSQTGRITLSPRRINVDQLVSECVKMLEHDTHGRKISWHIGPLDDIRADATMLRQVFQNLLSNAIKYTRVREHAVITVSSVKDKEMTVYSVADNGIGFDMSYVGKLFGVFQRLHRMEDYEGTGIGLANVRRVAERHRGQAWAEGRIDQGATFYVSFPNDLGTEDGSV